MLPNAYFAGLFDGEGFVRIDSHRRNSSGNLSYQLHAGIAMTHKPVIRLCFERWGGFFKGDDSFRNKNPRNRTIYRWAIVTNNAYRFLSDIREFSIVKHEQIEIALAFQDHIALHKTKMVGANADPIYKQQVFAERAMMCDRMRILKKENFPLVVNDPMLVQATNAKVPFS